MARWLSVILFGPIKEKIPNKRKNNYGVQNREKP